MGDISKGVANTKKERKKNFGTARCINETTIFTAHTWKGTFVQKVWRLHGALFVIFYFCFNEQTAVRHMELH
jgi:hypothetical protein